MTSYGRVGLAFVSFVLGLLAFELTMSVSTLLHNGVRVVLSTLVASVQMLLVYGIAAFPAVLLALPVVMAFEDAEGRRTWILLAIGSLIGPVFMVVWTFLAGHGRLNWEGNGASIELSFWIGGLTTVIYVLLLRRFGGARA